MQIILFVGLGGGLGAISRYLVSLATLKWWSDAFPLGTLLANVIGCFLIGFLMFYFLSSGKNSPLMPFLITGFLGGFTTFSTFSYETISLFTDGAITKGLLNLSLTLVFCFLGVALGIFLGRLIFNRN